MAGGRPGAPDLQYKDYYEVLGVPKTASQAEIKKAFRKLARQHHPDAKPGDAVSERKFKEINEANEVLSDPDKRKKYDALGKDWAAYDRAGAKRPGGGAAAGDPFGPGGPFAGYAQGAGGGNVRYEFRTGGDRRRGLLRLLPDVLRRGRPDDRDRRARAARGAATGPPAAPRSRTSSPGWAWPAAAAGGTAHGPDAGRATAAPAPKPVHEATAEITLDEAYHGTTRLVEVDGKRLEITIPAGRRHRHPDPADRPGPRRRRPVRRREGACPTPATSGAAPTSTASCH